MLGSPRFSVTVPSIESQSRFDVHFDLFALVRGVYRSLFWSKFVYKFVWKLGFWTAWNQIQVSAVFNVIHVLFSRLKWLFSFALWFVYLVCMQVKYQYILCVLMRKLTNPLIWLNAKSWWDFSRRQTYSKYKLSLKCLIWSQFKKWRSVLSPVLTDNFND